MSAVPPKVRMAVERRSGGRCEVCRMAWGSHMHHKLMRSHGGSHSEDNLLHVCFQCHERIHANPARSYELGHLTRGVS